MWKDCICEKICYYTVFSLECKKNQLPESQKSKNIGDEGSFDRVSRSIYWSIIQSVSSRSSAIPSP